MFSNRDAQTGICAAKIKEETGEFGKWKGHMCRYERPYMCERPLNSKMDSSGNTPTWYLVFLCWCGTSFTSLLMPYKTHLQLSALRAGTASVAAATGWSVTPTCWPLGTRPSPSAPIWALTCWSSTGRRDQRNKRSTSIHTCRDLVLCDHRPWSLCHKS